jgi:DNA repair photolyase
MLEVLAEHPGLSVCIITKSPLITRDIDLLTRIARISRLSVHLSLISLDRDLARRLEPRAPTPDARLRALARLRAADIETGINVMPVLPAITDAPEALERLVQAVAERGASYVNACPLRLRSSARMRYLPFIEKEFPHLAGRYRATYANDHKVSEEYTEGLRSRMRALCETYGVAYGYYSRAPYRAIEEKLAGDDQLELPELLG